MAEGNDPSASDTIKMSELSSANRQKLDDLRSLMHDKSKEGLMTYLESGWDINQLFLNNVPVKSGKELPCDQIAAIHLAVDVGWLEGLQLLIEAGADVNLRDYCDGVVLSGENSYNRKPQKLMFTPLMRAVWLWPRPQSLEIVKFLLENGADPNLTCPYTNHTAISVAVKCRNLPVVDLLLNQYNVDLTGMFYTETGAKTDILSFACDTILPGALSECRIHLEKPSQFCARAFHKEKKPQKVEDSSKGFNLVNYLVSDGAGGSSDHFLFEGFKLIKDLVSNGAIVSANSFDVLQKLRFDSTPDFDPKILDFLFKNGIDINDVKDGSTLFSRAVSRYSHTNYIRWLIRHGANINLSHRDVFILSLVARNYELYELMLHAGLKTSQRDRDVLQQILLKQNARPVPLERLDIEDRTEESKCTLEKFKTWNFGQRMQTEMQERDLMEFSDDTLHMYPTANLWKFRNFNFYFFLCRTGFVSNTSQSVHFKLSTEEEEQIRQIFAILSEPPSLKWRCRQWIRQNLVSLSPSVIQSLHLPSELKRYILCHDL